MIRRIVKVKIDEDLTGINTLLDAYKQKGVVEYRDVIDGEKHKRKIMECSNEMKVTVTISNKDGSELYKCEYDLNGFDYIRFKDMTKKIKNNNNDKDGGNPIVFEC